MIGYFASTLKIYPKLEWPNSTSLFFLNLYPIWSYVGGWRRVQFFSCDKLILSALTFLACVVRNQHISRLAFLTMPSGDRRHLLTLRSRHPRAAANYNLEFLVVGIGTEPFSSLCGLPAQVATKLVFLGMLILYI